LAGFNAELASNLQNQPLIYFPLLEAACRTYARTFYTRIDREQQDAVIDPFVGFQVLLKYSNATSLGIRDLNSTSVGKLVRIPGIVISASNVVCKPSQAYIMCKECAGTLSIPITSSFGSFSLPRTCQSANGPSAAPQACPMDPYVVVADKCICIDQQTLKLQESPDMVPVGELPRHVLLSVDRSLTNKISPGSKVVVNGIFSIYQAKSSGPAASSIRSPYIKVLGIENEAEANHMEMFFSEEEEREFIAFSKSCPDLPRRFAQNIAPSIYGNEDIKIALACLLFGGSCKNLSDGIRIRGDINVLLLGDPGVAKSQFLKFVEKIAPISVYTSGKGSSAAGLTASVIRDPGTGEFYLEGGAMVLADGGVVCIDEFDKMNEEDRVAIHEAMEQQTISIAKAGITTILNSRASVLAAANPLFGRYDEMKSPGENIDFSTTILSRFDMIFVVRDDHDVGKDTSLAKHVLSVHSRGANGAFHANSNETVSSAEGCWEIGKMSRYIAYCKAKCHPRLSAAAAEKLANHYVSIRSELLAMESASTERSSIPITVRQLEAIVRIAESLAKITLSPVAGEEHIDEAIRLFRVSTMQAVLSGHSLEGMTRPDLIRQVERIEKVIKERVAIGSTVSVKALVREMSGNKGFPEHAVLRCLDLMVKQEKMMFRSQQKLVVRVQ
jgi:DNA replication licensing factor MCM5